MVHAEAWVGAWGRGLGSVASETVCIHGTQEIQWRGLHVCTCVSSDKL